MENFMQENGAQQHFTNKKRKNNFSDDDNERVSMSNKLLLLTPSPSVYHAEGVISAPYGIKHNGQETLYATMKDTIFVNVQVYDEVLVRNGVHFLADEKGVYDKTVEGKR